MQQVKLRGRKVPESFPMDLVGLVAGIGALAVIYGGFRAFYFDGSFLQALSFVSDERMFNEIIAKYRDVDPGLTLFGVHAFADYVMPYYWATLASPWVQDATHTINYLPTVIAVIKPFLWLPYRLGLGIFELAMAGALAFPMFYASRGRRWSVRVLAVVLLGLLTGPTIASLDRANVQGFVPIFLFGFAIAVLRERWGWATAFLVIAASLKIYPLLLVLVLMAVRRWRWVVATIVVTVLVNVVALPLVSQNLWPSARYAFMNPWAFLDRTFEQFMSYNVALGGGLAHGLVMVGLPSGAEWIAHHSLAITVAALVLTVPLIWLTRIELWVRIILAMLLTTSAMPLVYPYAVNWVVAAAALAVFMAARATNDSGRCERMVPRWQWAPLLISLAVLCAPYPVFVPGSAAAGTPVSLVAFASALVSLGLPVALWLGWLRERHAWVRDGR